MTARAEAWEAGWEACANYLQDAECDPAHWERYHVNPYRNEAEPKPRGWAHPATMIGRGQ